MLECDSILKRFFLGFRPTDVGDPFTSEPDHERVFAVDLLCIHGKELGNSIRHHLLELGADDRFEAAPHSSEDDREGK